MVSLLVQLQSVLTSHHPALTSHHPAPTSPRRPARWDSITEILWVFRTSAALQSQYCGNNSVFFRAPKNLTNICRNLAAK